MGTAIASIVEAGRWTTKRACRVVTPEFKQEAVRQITGVGWP